MLTLLVSPRHSTGMHGGRQSLCCHGSARAHGCSTCVLAHAITCTSMISSYAHLQICSIAAGSSVHALLCPHQVYKHLLQSARSMSPSCRSAASYRAPPVVGGSLSPINHVGSPAQHSPKTSILQTARHLSFTGNPPTSLSRLQTEEVQKELNEYSNQMLQHQQQPGTPGQGQQQQVQPQQASPLQSLLGARLALEPSCDSPGELQWGDRSTASITVWNSSWYVFMRTAAAELSMERACVPSSVDAPDMSCPRLAGAALFVGCSCKEGLYTPAGGVRKGWRCTPACRGHMHRASLPALCWCLYAAAACLMLISRGHCCSVLQSGR
jgi:hypothetical protein